MAFSRLIVELTAALIELITDLDKRVHEVNVRKFGENIRYSHYAKAFIRQSYKFASVLDKRRSFQ